MHKILNTNYEESMLLSVNIKSFNNTNYKKKRKSETRTQLLQLII